MCHRDQNKAQPRRLKYVLLDFYQQQRWSCLRDKSTSKYKIKQALKARNSGAASAQGSCKEGSVTLRRTKVRVFQEEVTAKLTVKIKNNRASDPPQYRESLPIINMKRYRFVNEDLQPHPCKVLTEKQLLRNPYFELALFKFPLQLFGSCSPLPRCGTYILQQELLLLPNIWGSTHQELPKAQGPAQHLLAGCTGVQFITQQARC